MPCLISFSSDVTLFKGELRLGVGCGDIECGDTPASGWAGCLLELLAAEADADQGAADKRTYQIWQQRSGCHPLYAQLTPLARASMLWEGWLALALLAAASLVSSHAIVGVVFLLLPAPGPVSVAADLHEV